MTTWASFSSLKLGEESERLRSTEARKKLKTFFEKIARRGSLVEVSMPSVQTMTQRRSIVVT